MELVTEPVAKTLRHADIHTANDWLDAISAGDCNESEFFGGVDELLRRAPDTGWELLARLDQYYRRRKISAETFGILKPHLQNLLMGKGDEPSQAPARAGAARASTPVLRPTATPPTAKAPRAAHAATAPTPAKAPHPPASRTTAKGPPATAPAPLSEPMQAAVATRSEAHRFASRSRTVSGTHSRPAPANATAAHTAASAAASTTATHTASAAASTTATHTASAAPSATATHTAAATATDAPATTVSSAAPTAQPAVRPARSIQVGSTLRGRYRIDGVLGQGGMGTVFDAVDEFRVDETRGDQRVAIKVLHTAVTHRPRLFAELRREFQHLQCLSHPNIVRVHEFDRDGDTAFFTMERLSGAPLDRLLGAHRDVPLYRPYALAILRDVGAAVAHAHERGVVHGDLNPVNVLITDGGEIRVLDFGASHQLRRGPWVSDYDASQPETRVATPSYASCQVLEGEPADVRDDAYALACITYVLLTGKHPFRQHSSLKARSMRFKPARPRGLTPRQWRALKAGLEFDRARRPADLHAWLHQMQVQQAPHLPPLPELMQPRAPERSFTRWVAIAAAIVGVTLAGWWLTARLRELSPVPHLGETVDVRRQASPQTDTSGHESASPSQPALTNQTTPGYQPPLTNPVMPAKPPARANPPASATPAVVGALKRTPLSRASTAGSPSSVNAAVSPNVAAIPPATAKSDTEASADQTSNAVHARVELTADTVDVAPGETMARIVVHRSRTMRGDVSFNLWTEPGTAKPGRDFVPVNSELEQIPDGKGTLTLFVSILNDPGRRESRSFYVFIDDPSENAVLGPRTFTQVTLPDME